MLFNSNFLCSHLVYKSHLPCVELLHEVRVLHVAVLIQGHAVDERLELVLRQRQVEAALHGGTELLLADHVRLQLVDAPEKFGFVYNNNMFKRRTQFGLHE